MGQVTTEAGFSAAMFKIDIVFFSVATVQTGTKTKQKAKEQKEKMVRIDFFASTDRDTVRCAMRLRN